MYGKIAAEADNAGRYQDAVDNYLKAVEIFTYMIKCKYYLVYNNYMI